MKFSVYAGTHLLRKSSVLSDKKQNCFIPIRRRERVLKRRMLSGALCRRTTCFPTRVSVQFLTQSFFTRYNIPRRRGESFDYHAWLTERQDEESRSKLIFWDLMHHRENEAVAEFKRMSVNYAGFSLKKWFTREDFMDYGYILAEELTIRGEYYDAFLLLEQIIKMEYSYEYFRLFFPEVMEFTLHILKQNIEGTVNDELVLDAWERALDLGFSVSDDAFFLRKMAVLYRKIGDERTAEVCLEEAARTAGMKKQRKAVDY